MDPAEGNRNQRGVLYRLTAHATETRDPRRESLPSLLSLAPKLLLSKTSKPLLSSLRPCLKLRPDPLPTLTSQPPPLP